MAGIIALEILFAPKKKFTVSILLQIIIIGLSTSLSQLLLFPTLIGYDPFTHQVFTSLIIKSHHIPYFGNYYNFGYERIPIFHLLIANTSLITGLSYKLSSIVSVSFLLIVIGVLLTYNIGKYLISDKIGLLGALILVLSNYIINAEIWIIPNFLGGIFFIVIVYLLLNFKDRNDVLFPILIIFLMFVLILTHTIVSMILVITLITGWFSILIYNYFNKKSKISIPLTLGIMFTVSMLVWWMYASNTIFDMLLFVIIKNDKINIIPNRKTTFNLLCLSRFNKNPNVIAAGTANKSSAINNHLP